MSWCEVLKEKGVYIDSKFFFQAKYIIHFMIKFEMHSDVKTSLATSEPTKYMLLPPSLSKEQE